jgi:hypothetical protein
MVIMPTLARSSGAERRMPRRTSGFAERRSMPTKVASSRPARASPPIVAGSPQPVSGASTIVRTSSSIPAVSVIAPAKSKLRRTPAVTGPSLASTRGAATSSAAATGTGSRKVQRQPSSVNRPPKTRPSEKPLAPTAV